MPLWPVVVVLAAPSAASVATYFMRADRGRYVTLASASAVAVAALWTLIKVSSTPYSGIDAYVTPVKDFILDPIASWILLIISMIYLLISVYAVGFTSKEVEEGVLRGGRASLMHSLINVFVLTMLLSSISNNVFMLWVAIEATTLASAFLVALYGRAESLEAAWKYVIICSVGLVFSLYGTSLLYAEGGARIGPNAVFWSSLMTHRAPAASTAVLAAFIALLVGYGTKAGLAPMWTWLPDAHAEAPAPVSALLSGVLIKCAFIGLVRYVSLATAYDVRVVPELTLALGLLSMCVASLFIIVSKDVKRLLAFHSVENMGIAAVGVGFATMTSVIGGLYHVLTHALVKTMLFLLSGMLIWIYGTRDMRFMGRLLKVHRVLGFIIVAGGLALGCSPPFAMFLSSYLVAYGGLLAGNLPAVIIYVAASAVVFAGIVSHTLHISVGEPRANSSKYLTDGGGVVARFKAPKTCLAVLIAVIATVTILGLYMPHTLYTVLSYSAKEVLGGG